jgi:hypothetical protein
MAVFSFWILRLYVLYRWARLTTRQYGLFYLAARDVPKPRHAAIGRGVVRDTGQHTGAITGWNLTTGEILMFLEREREAVLVDA